MNRRRPVEAFTLIELIMVIAIIAVVAAIALPILRGWRKGDAMLAATRQLLDAVGHARQLAISQHTTVYMVFAPPTLWADPFYNRMASSTAPENTLTTMEKVAATNVLDKQFTGYTFVSLRSVGDQPGRSTPHYLASWQSLPESIYIADWKFGGSAIISNPVTSQVFVVGPFAQANNIPFPTDDAAYHVPPLYDPPKGFAYAGLAYIAFNYLGQLTSGKDEYIPLAHGSVLVARDPQTKMLQLAAPSAIESPAGGSTSSSFNLIHIDWLTGRARLERQEIK